MKGTSSWFSFQNVTTEKTAKIITNLDNEKAVQSTDIPTKLVKKFGCLFSSFLAFNVSKCINEATNVDAFKKAEVWSFYKKDGRTEKSNYRFIRVLSNVSKIYKRCLYDQIYFYFDKIYLR